jgi:hypothetical protein
VAIWEKLQHWFTIWCCSICSQVPGHNSYKALDVDALPRRDQTNDALRENELASMMKKSGNSLDRSREHWFKWRYHGFPYCSSIGPRRWIRHFPYQKAKEVWRVVVSTCVCCSKREFCRLQFTPFLIISYWYWWNPKNLGSQWKRCSAFLHDVIVGAPEMVGILFLRQVASSPVGRVPAILNGRVINILHFFLLNGDSM